MSITKLIMLSTVFFVTFMMGWYSYIIQLIIPFIVGATGMAIIGWAVITRE
jgi:hypothetical protein